jgi:hypothetical protein
MIPFGNENEFLGLPLLFGLVNGNDEHDNNKLGHDSYNVYVNDDYIGSKTLVSSVEKIDDVSNYLKKQGCDDFSSRLIGNQYSIHCNTRDSKNIKDTLQVYLNNR